MRAVRLATWWLGAGVCPSLFRPSRGTSGKLRCRHLRRVRSLRVIERGRRKLGWFLVETILAVVDDLFFLSKIQQTAKLVGVAVEPVAPAKLADRAAQGAVCAVIVDLNHRSGSALDAVRATRMDARTGAVRVVGFLSHVQTELATSAREAGCDQVLARSAFSHRLPELLKELAGNRTGARRAQ